jgi:predicted dehydrogenase
MVKRPVRKRSSICTMANIHDPNYSRRRFLQAAGGTLAAAPLIGAASPAAAQVPDIRLPEVPGQKVGWAIVGIGGLTANQILPAFPKCQKSKVVSFVSGRPEKAARFAQVYGVDPKNIYNYENFDSIKDNPDIDVIYIVLPNSMHAEYTIRAAKAGKHVLCEKPMAVSAKECEAMIAACRAAKRQLAIGYRLHFEPFNLEMARLSREKVFGAVKVIEAAAGFRIGDPTQWRLKKALAGGGSMLDVGVYALQAARYISGEEPVSVSAAWTKTDAVKFKDVEEETIQFTLRFPSGCVANCTGTYATRMSRWYAGAEDGWFELAPAFGYGPFKGRTNGPDGIKDIDLQNVNHFEAEMDAFAACLLNNTPTTVPGEEGLRDLRITEAIYQSAASGKAVALKA